MPKKHHRGNGNDDRRLGHRVKKEEKINEMELVDTHMGESRLTSKLFSQRVRDEEAKKEILKEKLMISKAMDCKIQGE